MERDIAYQSISQPTFTCDYYRSKLISTSIMYHNILECVISAVIFLTARLYKGFTFKAKNGTIQIDVKESMNFMYQWKSMMAAELLGISLLIGRYLLWFSFTVSRQDLHLLHNNIGNSCGGFLPSVSQ